MMKNKLLVLFNLHLSILFISFGLFVSKGSSLISHEMWLDTTTFQQSVGKDIQISLKNGQMFQGAGLSYFKSRFSDFYYISNEQKIEIESRMGDTPAATISLNTNGLLTGVYVSKKSTITYKSIDKFANFVSEKGEDWVIQKHGELKFPKNNFKEEYYRFSKILIGVGDASGSDKNVGLKHELVALTNPYIISSSDKFFVQLLFNNEPQKNRQITIFERDIENKVNIRTTLTNSNGIGKFEVTEGHDYLLDNVILELNDNSEDNVFWKSYWAALTFRASNDPQ
ncbi:DUF4198 domain-containing protein [Paracoccaceae bacterium]|jgi:hypothetical protein|nr:DUF4198 domain-containing protein [Paracoccaceae bacterium]MDG1677006.1 DUF4198 domain-containing protein [Paracoccaceae bacterium]